MPAAHLNLGLIESSTNSTVRRVEMPSISSARSIVQTSRIASLEQS